MEQSRSRYASWIALVLSALLLAAVMMLCIPQNQAQAVEAAPDAQATQVFTGTITAGDQEAALPAASATPAKKAGKASKYALLEKNGKVYPCNKKGKKLSATWKGGTTFNYLMVAPNVTKIPKQFNYKYVGFSGVKMKLKSVTFMLKGGKNACKSVAASSPLSGQTTLKTLKNFNKTKITSIGKESLAYTGLTSISLPKTLKTIGTNAFRGDSKLKKVVGLEKTKVTKIVDYAFAESAVKTISFPAKLTKIGENAFRSTKLTAIKLNKTKVTSIGPDAFAETKATVAYLPASLKTIGKEAFASTPLAKVYGLGQTKVTSVGSYAFALTNVAEISLPSTCTSIGSCAFYDCPKLTGLRIASPTVVSWSTGVVASTPIEAGSGHVYVPSSLAETYKSAYGWQSIAGAIIAM